MKKLLVAITALVAVNIEAKTSNAPMWRRCSYNYHQVGPKKLGKAYQCVPNKNASADGLDKTKPACKSGYKVQKAIGLSQANGYICKIKKTTTK